MTATRATGEISPFQKIDIIDLLIRGVGMRKIANGQGLPVAAVKAIAEHAGHPDDFALRQAKAELKKAPKMPFGPPPKALPRPRPGRTNPSPVRAAELDDHPAIPVIRRLLVAADQDEKATTAAILSGFDLNGRGILIVILAAIIAPTADAVDPIIRTLSIAVRDWRADTIIEVLDQVDQQARGDLIVAMVASLDPDTDLSAALEWCDLPPAEWSPETVAREAARWRAGARDRSAVSGHEQDPAV